MIEWIKAFLNEFFCPHTEGRLLSIEWDGETIYECVRCKKTIRKGF